MADMDITRLKIDKVGAGRPPRKRRKLPWVTGGVVLLLGALLAVQGVFTPKVTVETTTVSLVYPSQAITLLNASGYVVAQRKAALAAKATGRLDWLGVEEGSRVRAGQIIARLESRDAAAARQQAAAGLQAARAGTDQARTELEDAGRAFRRQKELLGQGIVPQADFDAAEARYLRAKAGVVQAEANVRVAAAALAGAEVALDYTLIRSPFAAVVLTKNADVGDIVTPLGAAANAKASVVTIADADSLEVEADVSESNLGQVKVGQPCEIQLDALPEKRFRGVLHVIVPTADRSKATVMVKVRFRDKDARILPEMSAKVAFLEREVAPTEQRPKTAVSRTAVKTEAGHSLVFLVRDDRVVATPVTLGGQVGDLVEITSGAKAGDKVVSKPLAKMKNGVSIKTAEK
jgi:HlyD family secretion protein